MTVIPLWKNPVSEKQARKNANKELYELSTGNNQKYYNHIPFGEIANILAKHGFIEILFSVNDSKPGRIFEQVGQSTWLTVTWFKMPSDRYEVIAYVS